MQTSIIQDNNDDIEKRYLSNLAPAGITPKIFKNGNNRVYSTEFASLTIENYPVTDKATGLFIPQSSEENLNSTGLILIYIGTVIEESDCLKAVDALSRVLDKNKPEVIYMGGFAIKISTREGKQNVTPMVAFEINKIPSNGHVSFKQNKDKLFRFRAH